jgi:hypothetical protein
VQPAPPDPEPQRLADFGTDMSLRPDDEVRALADAEADERLAAERLDVVHAPLKRPGEPCVLAPEQRVLRPDSEDELGRHLAVGLPGVAASRLLQAIVDASRPNAPGLMTSTGALAGKAVTKLTYPGGAVLYLRAVGSRVFYVGTQSERLAAKALGELP